jgi:hypothetical protein
MTSSTSTGVQQIYVFTRRGPAEPAFLEAAAGHVLDSLVERAQFLAWGPAVSVDFETNSIEVECTLDARTSESAAERVHELIGQALAECEYETRTSHSDDAIFA